MIDLFDQIFKYDRLPVQPRNYDLQAEVDRLCMGMKTMSIRSKAVAKAQFSPKPSFVPQQSRLLHRSSTSHAGPATAPPIVHEVLRSPGQPLDAATRTHMEPHFGHNFSRVQIHAAAPRRIQAKLTINHPNDRYEQEADRIADAVMRMPEPVMQRQVEPEEGEEEEETLQTKPLAAQITPLIQRQIEPEEEEEEELIQAKETSGQTSHVSPIVQTQIHSLRGGGLPLSPSIRNFFEPRFGHDFSHVRIHADERSADIVHALDARAFTYENGIWFGENEFRPDYHAGRRLLAHELTHTIQQERRGLVPVIRRDCPSPTPDFDLLSSPLGTEMQSELAGVTRLVRGPDDQFTRTPIVSPSDLLQLLNSSNRFRGCAQAVNRIYCRRGTCQGLDFDFHVDRERGTEFERGQGQDPSVVRVYVTDLVAVVRGIVHEIVHASHTGLPRVPREGRSGGAVTQVEWRHVREESRTRVEENQIMGEITGSPDWQSLTGGATIASAVTEYEQVRGSFVSGMPMLTYQEFFIVEEMKRRNRVSGVDEDQAVRAAQEMVATHSVPYVRQGNLNDFTIDDAEIARHRRILGRAVPAEPPPIDEAVECVRIFRCRDEWRSSLRRTGRLPEGADVSPGCRLLIEVWHDYIRRNEPYDRFERRMFFHDVLQEMWIRHRLAISMRAESSAFMNWYSSLPQQIPAIDAVRFFEWVLIAESMSNEWQGVGMADTEIRRQHMEFLEARIGPDLSGISRPPAGHSQP